MSAIASRVVSALAVCLVALPAWAAPGDVLRRLPLPVCPSTAMGLAFDGTTLYYTERNPPVPGPIHAMSPTTGADGGTFMAQINGSPVGVGGLEWDPNRRRLWVGGNNRIYLVSFADQTLEQRALLNHLAQAVGYQMWRDEVWEARGSSGNLCFEGGRSACGGMSGDDQGLTFDGIDFWRYRAGLLSGTGLTGVLFAYSVTDGIDYSRVIDLPGVAYADIAFDCVTFAVPVVWVANQDACEVLAVEVATRGPCLGPADYLARAFTDGSAAQRRAKLPVTSVTANVLLRAATPLNQFEPFLLADTTWPLVFYRLLGYPDVDRGNRIRVLKRGEYDFVVTE